MNKSTTFKKNLMILMFLIINIVFFNYFKIQLLLFDREQRLYSYYVEVFLKFIKFFLNYDI